MRRLLALPIDWFILLVPLILSITGVITIFSITVSSGKTSIAYSQAVFLLIGLVGLVFFTLLDYRLLGGASWLVYGVGMLLLGLLVPQVAAHFPLATTAFGARRWINFGFFQLQPGETMKLASIILSARLLSVRRVAQKSKRLVLYLMAALLPVGLVLSQPDLGTAIVLGGIFFTVLLLAGPTKRQILLLIALLLLGGWLGLANLKDYQRNRIETFLNPSADPLKSGYNVRQSLIAVGSGGLIGKGFGQGSQTALNFLPVAHTDFFFASFAEATGFIGSTVVILLYGLLFTRIVSLAEGQKDSFGRLLVLAIGVKILLQTTINIGMNIGLLPVTGIPLPFMSYGGTALVIDLICIGILQSVHIRQKRTLFN